MRLASFVHPRNLFRQVGRHRRSIRLVVGGHLRAEGRSRQVERGGDVFGPVILDQLPQHGDEDVDGVRGLAARDRSDPEPRIAWYARYICELPSMRKMRAEPDINGEGEPRRVRK